MGRPERRLLLGVLLILALVLPVGAWALDRARQPEREGGAQAVVGADEAMVQRYPAGTRAPELRLTRLDGGTLDLAAYHGRPVLLNFWATWCGPCVREFPLLRRTLEQRRGQGLVVIGVLVNDKAAVARRFVREHGGTWPVGIDQGAKAAAAFKAIGLPETVFVRKDGTLATRVLGELTQDRLDAQLAPLLAR
ncbi:MAG TPA: TlpA disulfide reductase family protein [Actinomycetes bacterium]|nr:TlpA disulfide reductase family protein [Actinomycetes bacterium]